MKPLARTFPPVAAAASRSPPTSFSETPSLDSSPATFTWSRIPTPPSAAAPPPPPAPPFRTPVRRLLPRHVHLEQDLDPLLRRPLLQFRDHTDRVRGVDQAHPRRHDLRLPPLHVPDKVPLEGVPEPLLLLYQILGPVLPDEVHAHGRERPYLLGRVVLARGAHPCPPRSSPDTAPPTACGPPPPPPPPRTTSSRPPGSLARMPASVTAGVVTAVPSVRR